MRLRRAVAVVASLALALPATVAATAVVTAAPAGAAVPTDLFFSEYIEGSGLTTRRSRSSTAPGRRSTWPPAATRSSCTSTASPHRQPDHRARPAPSPTATCTSWPRPTPTPRILAQADQTSAGGRQLERRRRGGAAQGRRAGPIVDVDRPDRGRPRAPSGAPALTSTADNTLRRKATVSAGDTDPADAFDPAAEWDGFANDTFDGFGAHTFDRGGPATSPSTVACGGPLSTVAGTAASRVVTATDPDDTVVDVAVTGVSPGPAAGTIARTAFTPAAAVGGTAEATITVTPRCRPGPTPSRSRPRTDDATARPPRAPSRWPSRASGRSARCRARSPTPPTAPPSSRRSAGPAGVACAA